MTKNTSFGVLKEEDRDDLNDSSIFERADECNIDDDDHTIGFQKSINT